MRKTQQQTCDQVGPYIRKPWERVKTVTPVSSESRTQANLGNDTNVNQIVARFSRTGVMPQPTSEPVYADVTNLQGLDLTQLIENAREAREHLEQINQEKNRRLQEAQKNANKPKPEETQNATEPPPTVE